MLGLSALALSLSGLLGASTAASFDWAGTTGDSFDWAASTASFDWAGATGDSFDWAAADPASVVPGDA
jgi:hypothetical protein